ncbi:hypothetical protein DBR45_12985 [Pseudomonas sp. HMWF031]|nr:hypothetical protein DBR45_12985 [Pseudomonas sp. HMWF031]
MWLIRQYAATEQSSADLLKWLKPYKGHVLCEKCAVLKYGMI